jgi:hypothetical protein
MFLSLQPLKKKLSSLHRGQLLQDAVKASRIKKEEVAARAGYQRTSYYKHIREPELPYHILTAYGKAIKHDFTEYLPDMPRYMIEEAEAPYNQPADMEEARRIIDHWKTKYIELLERFNQVVLELKNK